ncbi:uncharacterized protein F5147DRAFT_589076, partial [Suillus discolor]
SASMKSNLAAFWADRLYLIVNEVSMVGHAFLAMLSYILSVAKSASGSGHSDQAFGEVHVIIVGDFHQFQPVATRRSAPLFWPCDTARDTTDEQLGRNVYEEFTVVVQLKEQIYWEHVHYRISHEHHIRLLRSLTITNPKCPPTSFSIPPWNDAVLITPRHAVRKQWNAAMGQEFCRRTDRQLLVSAAYDTIHGCPLTLEERLAVAMKQKKGSSQEARGGLPHEVDVMVTFNVETDLDVENCSQLPLPSAYAFTDYRSQGQTISHSIIDIGTPQNSNCLMHPSKHLRG